MKAEIEKLFHELADQPPEARERYFAEHEVDGSTRQEVEALLAFDSGASTYLQRDVSIAASRALPLLDANGWRCGLYRLMEVVGRGGMGAVYRAERADGEVTQQVAVKLPVGSRRRAGESARRRTFTRSGPCCINCSPATRRTNSKRNRSKRWHW